MIDILTFRKIMLDTAPFIYFMEENPKYISAIRYIFSQIDAFELEAFTSVITLIEVLIHPKRAQNQALEKQYLNILLKNANLQVLAIDENIALKAAELRARYDIKIPDSIQIAAGIVHHCDAFVTNDAQLKKIEEIKVVVLDEAVAVTSR